MRGAAQRAMHAAGAFPPALLVVLVGLGIVLVAEPNTFAALRFGPSTPKILHIRARDWIPAITRAALPQLPVCAPPIS